MKIAIGTTNAAKLNALSSAIDTCVYFGDENIEIIPMKVESGISDMPLSLEENNTGAYNRAKNMKKSGVIADYYIGMEGGTTYLGTNDEISKGTAYLFGTVCIMNPEGKAHIGLTPFLEVPKEIQRRLYENGEDLGKIQSELSKDDNINHKNGSYGVWTDDMITRSDSFEKAFMCAIAPFYNSFYNV